MNLLPLGRSSSITNFNLDLGEIETFSLSINEKQSINKWNSQISFLMWTINNSRKRIYFETFSAINYSPFQYIS